MTHPPGSGKDIVAKIVAFLRNNGGTAVLNGQVLAIEFGCNPSNVLWDIRRLKGCGIMTPIGPHGSGHRNSRFSLSDQFKEGEEWREVLSNYTPLIDHKKSVPGESKNNLAVTLIDYLKSRGGRAVINGTAVARELGFSQSAVCYALRNLLKKGLIATSGLNGSGVTNVEYFLTESGKSCVVSGPSQRKRIINKTKDIVGTSDNDTALKLSISRELVQVYEKLNEAQQLAIQLQSEKNQLEVRIRGLEDELQSEKSSHYRDTNDIATLELELRELRQITDRNAKRVVFDHRGVQS